MSTTLRVLKTIEAYCASAGIAESTFGKRILNDGKFVARLRAGGTITLKTFERLQAVLVVASIPVISNDHSENPESHTENSE